MKNKWLLFFIIPISAFADQLLMSNVPNGCSSGLNTDTYILATFTPNQYQCNSGYYVPANNDGCVMCPEYYDCNGGNFTFNETDTQGAKFKTFITSDIKNGCRTDFTKSINNTANISPVFTPNVHTCLPGYYLPANTDGCVECPENNYCVGGIYTFNETETQGIAPCPESHPYAPVGMWAESQCGRKLYVDGEYLYLHKSPAAPTEHRLYVRVNDNVYSANMTTVPTVINRDSARFLKVMYNSTEYYVCDDTTYKN